MPREKKDGCFINFYVKRSIFERSKNYADSRDLTMTRALERLLKKALNDEDATSREEKIVQRRGSLHSALRNKIDWNLHHY